MKLSDKPHYDIAVIGGGAGGLLCAALIKIRKPELSVTIIEAQDRVGRKLLTTGNGRCNLTNLYTTADMYHGSFKEGAEYLLSMCPPMMTVDIFESLGLLTTSEDDGRVYPVSRQANSVLDVLRIAINKYNIDVHTKSPVTDIKPEKGHHTIICSDKQITSDSIVIATGSKSSPSTGADDSMLQILRKLGHTVTARIPALCPVAVKSEYLKSLKGVRATGKVSILKDGKVLRQELGEIQFTENALSGICVFNLARIANSEKNTQISVSLLPDRDYNDILSILRNKLSSSTKGAKAEELLIGFFNKMLGICLLKEAKISLGKPVSEITDAELKYLARIINDWRFSVVPSKDYSRSQVTAGGILGAEIDEKTMRSKKIEKLYILGEAVDCDGDCGGMNLQFAFASAYCAACDITL